MTVLDLSDLNLFSIGNEIQLYGAIYSGGGKIYLIPLPDEDADELNLLPHNVLRMDAEDMAKFLRQTDLLDIEGPGKAILRKSQRQIDQQISWAVYRRDGYKCRYCGRVGPLTVDHVDLWEDGGATVEENLISSCRRCNKLRGRMSYEEWLESPDYLKVSAGLTLGERINNCEVVRVLPLLQGLRVKKQRSR